MTKDHKLPVMRFYLDDFSDREWYQKEVEHYLPLYNYFIEYADRTVLFISQTTYEYDLKNYSMNIKNYGTIQGDTLWK